MDSMTISRDLLEWLLSIPLLALPPSEAIRISKAEMQQVPIKATHTLKDGELVGAVIVPVDGEMKRRAACGDNWFSATKRFCVDNLEEEGGSSVLKYKVKFDSEVPKDCSGVAILFLVRGDTVLPKKDDKRLQVVPGSAAAFAEATRHARSMFWCALVRSESNETRSAIKSAFDQPASLERAVVERPKE